MITFATYNIKGGVGKTASAINLAYLSAHEGARTLVWDLDPQGAATYYFRIRPKVKGGSKALLRGSRDLDDLIKGTDFDNLDLLPADFSYRNMDLALSNTKSPKSRILKLLRPLDELYDHLFLDCPPSISLLSENIVHAADVILMPMIPTTLSLRTMNQFMDFFGGNLFKRITYMPFFSMADRRKRLHRDIMENLLKERPYFLNNHIPYSTEVENMGLERAPVGSYSTNTQASLAYESLWQEIKERLIVQRIMTK